MLRLFVAVAAVAALRLAHRRAGTLAKQGASTIRDSLAAYQESKRKAADGGDLGVCVMQGLLDELRTRRRQRPRVRLIEQRPQRQRKDHEVVGHADESSERCRCRGALLQEEAPDGATSSTKASRLAHRFKKEHSA